MTGKKNRKEKQERKTGKNEASIWFP